MNDFNYNRIQEIKRNNGRPNMVMYSKAVMEELKSHNFENAEELFLEMNGNRHTIREGSPFYHKHVHAYQRAITSIVRYAPTPSKAEEYAELYFRDIFEPLRNPGTEMIVLTNLVYVYGTEGSATSMAKGLDVIKLTIKIGAFEIDPLNYESALRGTNFNDPLEVFQTVSKKVLRYYNLAFSEDKKKLVPMY